MSEIKVLKQEELTAVAGGQQGEIVATLLGRVRGDNTKGGSAKGEILSTLLRRIDDEDTKGGGEL
ncbi:hypothetical protein [Parachitinimonas caeni]|uniref:Bacteriocin-like protein n=1 Tax=Parachitinimonas caeni TaxID=3031301 RepID=A0ABT7DRM9_9NEIS|nr:hypothetical protein [Parachitinimonas caeni]MDK2122719.1 hypothetical protein [Parachitinimonas caeni]